MTLRIANNNCSLWAFSFIIERSLSWAWIQLIEDGERWNWQIKTLKDCPLISNYLVNIVNDKEHIISLLSHFLGQFNAFYCQHISPHWRQLFFSYFPFLYSKQVSPKSYCPVYSSSLKASLLEIIYICIHIYPKWLFNITISE